MAPCGKLAHTAVEDVKSDAFLDDLQGKVLLVVRTGGTGRITAYQHLVSLGVRLIFVHPKPNFAEPVAWRWILTDTDDVPAMVRTVVETLQTWQPLTIDGALTFDEYGVFPVACLSQQLGIICCPAPPDVVKSTNDKSLFRRHCQLHHINAPRHLEVHHPDDVMQAIDAQWKFPVVMKPSTGAGSAFAKLISNQADLKEYTEAALSRLHNSADYSHWCTMGSKPHLQVEEYIGGQEVDIDAVVQRGQIMYAVISDNFETEKPYFCETGGLAPSILEADKQAALMAELEKFVASHGTAINAVLHFEAKYDFARSAAFVIEVNLRMGGAETYCLNNAVWGYNLAESYARLACGLPVPRQRSCTPMRWVASTNFQPNAEGVLRSWIVPDDVKQDAHFVGLTKYYDEGSSIELPPKAFTALGWMCASGNSPKDAVDQLAKLVGRVQINIS